MTALLAIAFLLAPAPALAHGGIGGWLTAGGARSFDPVFMAPLYLAAGLYLAGTFRLWWRAGHGRGVSHVQALCFWSGWSVLALALVSPLSLLSQQLFVAHMIEHELMVTVAAPLLVLSRPLGAFLWAFPPAWRQALGRFGRRPAVAMAWAVLTGAAMATFLQGAALWLWHVPALFSAALASETLHWLQHASFLVTALLFWWSLLAARHGHGAALFWLFLTILHTSFLGILLALSPTAWAPRQTDALAGWGLTPLQDQQLAGLVMWIPGGLIYTGVALALAASWIRSSDNGAKRRRARA